MHSARWHWGFKSGNLGPSMQVQSNLNIRNVFIPRSTKFEEYIWKLHHFDGVLAPQSDVNGAIYCLGRIVVNETSES